MSTKIRTPIGGPLASVPKSLLADALRIYCTKNPDYLAKLKNTTKLLDDPKIVDFALARRKRLLGV